MSEDGSNSKSINPTQNYSVSFLIFLLDEQSIKDTFRLEYIKINSAFPVINRFGH